MEEKHGFLKKLLIAIALILFILFCASQKQAHALVYKGQSYDPYTSSSDFTDSINTIGTGIKYHEIFLQNPKDLTNYNLIGFRVISFNYYYNVGSTNINCSGTQQMGTGDFAFNCTGVPDGHYADANALSLSAMAIYRPVNSDNISDNYYSPCWFSNEYSDTILCPTEPNTKLIGINISVRYRTVEKVNYTLSLGGSKLLFDYDNSDVVVQQGQTNTILQQQQDIMTGTDTTGASTKGTNDINSNANSLNSELDTAVGTGDFVSIFTTFFSQIDNSTCTPITLPIPYTNENLVLPCLGTEFQNRIPLIWTLYVTIITGVIVFRFWHFYIDMFKHLLDPYSTGLHGVSDIAGGGK